MEQKPSEIEQDANTVSLSHQRVPHIEVDFSACWDMVSMNEQLLSALHAAPFYRPGLLYSGFNADDMEKEHPADVYCSEEKFFFLHFFFT